MAINGKRYWGIIPPQPAAQIIEAAQKAEAIGLDGLWGIQLPGPPFLPLATAAGGTQKLKLGTGVSLAFTRSPLETALSALDLDLISGGRTVLGLGPSVRRFNENWHGVAYDPPLPRLREVITLIRLITEKGHTGELGKWEGEYYNVDFSDLNMLRHQFVPAFRFTCLLCSQARCVSPGRLVMVSPDIPSGRPNGFGTRSGQTLRSGSKKPIKHAKILI